MHKKIVKKLKMFLLVLLGLVISFSAVFGIIFLNWMKDLPDLDISKLQEVSVASLIYDKNNNLVTSYSYGINQEWANDDEIPPLLKEAFISIEDKDFYKHNGIYTKRFVAAILGQITGLADFGGSTITQQLIKNVYLTPELSYKRKAQEFVLAKKIEKKISKDEILNAYMNVIYMGGQNYGIKAAAKDYFNKDLKDLTLKEMALIAGLAKSPNGYNPKRNLEKGDLTPSNTRANDVLFTMHQQGKITDDAYENAIKEEFVVNPNKIEKGLYPYPHFIDYMINEVAYDMAKKEGDLSLIPNIKAKLREGGYKIYTNLDPKAQVSLQDSLLNYKNYPEIINYDKEKLGEQRAEAASVIIDRSTGGICAIAGGRDLPKIESSYNRAVHSAQPVGSIIKPLSIFAPSIEKGLGSGSVELDYRLPINGYDNNKWPGGPVDNRPMSMRVSMDKSHNVSAARFLYNTVGDELSMEYLYKLGVKPSRIKKTGQSLVLGTSDSTVMEMARAYSVFINNGKYIEPKTYSKVEDNEGNVLLDAKDFQVTRNVFAPSTVFIMNEMFKSEATNGTGVGAKINGITTGGKTGTHEDRVVTYAGISPYYLSVVRVSNDNYLQMKNAWGGTTAAGLFKDYMNKIHNGLKDKDIQTISMADANVEMVEVSSLSGKVSTGATRDLKLSRNEFYKKGTAPKDSDNTVIAVCGITGNLANNECYKAKHVKYKIFAGQGSILSGLDLKNIGVNAEIVYEMPKQGGHTEWKKKEDKKQKDEANKLIDQEQKREKEIQKQEDKSSEGASEKNETTIEVEIENSNDENTSNKNPIETLKEKISELKKESTEKDSEDSNDDNDNDDNGE